MVWEGNTLDRCFGRLQDHIWKRYLILSRTDSQQNMQQHRPTIPTAQWIQSKYLILALSSGGNGHDMVSRMLLSIGSYVNNFISKKPPMSSKRHLSHMHVTPRITFYPLLLIWHAQIVACCWLLTLCFLLVTLLVLETEYSAYLANTMPADALAP